MTPPVGISGICGNGAFTAFRWPGPNWSAGNTLTIVAPSFQAVKISVGVMAPGITGTPASTQARMTSGKTTGVTMKLAPASRADRSSSIEVTVPAPTLPRSPMRSRVRRIRSAAPGLLRVTSRFTIPPAITAGTRCSTWARGKNRRMPTMGRVRNSVSLNGVLMGRR